MPLHLQELVFHGVKDCDKIGADDTVNRRCVDIGEFAEGVRDPGVVDRNVEPAEPSDRSLCQLLGERFFGDVAWQSYRLSTKRPCRASGFLKLFFKDIG